MSDEVVLLQKELDGVKSELNEALVKNRHCDRCFMTAYQAGKITREFMEEELIALRNEKSCYEMLADSNEKIMELKAKFELPKQPDKNEIIYMPYSFYSTKGYEVVIEMLHRMGYSIAKTYPKD